MIRPALAVFLAGAGVMAAEILASRVLAPVFGASLSTWSVLIAVTLLLGSLGAGIGGVIAARASPSMLGGVLLLAAGGFAFAATGLLHPVGAENSSLFLGALLASCLLLAPILLPLAAVLPLSSTLAEPGGASGRIVGFLLALSTFGSLVGTLGAAWVLVPDVGLQRSFVALAMLMAAAGALAARGRVLRSVTTGAAVSAALWLVLLGPRPEEPLVRETAFGLVEVRRAASGAELRVDGILQGATSPLAIGRGALLRARQYVELLPFLHPRGTRALNVGLGAGVVPRALEAYGIDVESIEVNPALVDLARTMFGFDGRVHVGDGRVLLRRMTDRFDFVIFDVFQGEALPAHLVTREAFAEAKACLTEGGILCVHLIGRPHHVLTGTVAGTLDAVFEHRLCLRAGVGEELQDLYLFASDAALRIPPDPALGAAGWLGNEPFDPPSGGAVVTDDLNAIERLGEPLARALRRAS